MGRAGRIWRKGGAPRSLEEGMDGDRPVRLGERDSQGVPIGFIDRDGACYESLEERDTVRVAGAVEEAFSSWEDGYLEGDPPELESIARATCLGSGASAIAKDLRQDILGTPFHNSYRHLFLLAEDDNHITRTAREYVRQMRAWQMGASPGGEPDLESIAQGDPQAALFASQVWERILARKASQRSRRQDFREHREEVADPRHPLLAEGSFIVYPSFIDGAKLELQRVSATAAELEETQKRLEDLNERLRAAGLGELPPHVFSREPDEFDLLVEDLDIQERPVWQTSLQIPVGEDTLDVAVLREGVDEARRAGWKLEELVSEGPLLEEEVALEIVGRSLPPEDVKKEALDMLAEGEEHPHVRIAKMLGVSSEKTLQHAESIVLGQTEERALVFASANVFIPDIGEVQVSVSGESEEEVLRRARLLLPAARLEEE